MIRRFLAILLFALLTASAYASAIEPSEFGMDAVPENFVLEDDPGLPELEPELDACLDALTLDDFDTDLVSTDPEASQDEPRAPVLNDSQPMPDYEGEYVPWMAHLKDIVSVVIEDGITNVGNCSFRYCENLVSLTLPEGIKRIGDRSFVDCDSLESVDIPDSVTNIGAWAFDKCDSLVYVDLPENLTTLGTGAFNECVSLENIDIPEKIRDIGQDAFNKCNRLTEVTIPADVKYVGIYAFFCEDLSDIYFGGTVEEWSQFDRPHNPEYTTVHCSDGDI